MKTISKMMAVAAIAAGALIGTNAYAGAESRCKVCHDFGTTDKVGPHLKGVVGRKAGSTGFNYSKSLKDGGWVWDDAHLDKWLVDSKAAIKEFTGDPNAKTKMPPQHLKPEQVQEVIKFLKGL